MSTEAPAQTRTAGSWARDLAEQYDALARQFEKHPEDDRSRLGAVLNRGEAAKYHRIAADMDAAFPDGLPTEIARFSEHDASATATQP